MVRNLLIIVLALASCTATKVSNHSSAEKLQLSTVERDTPLTYQQVAAQFDSSNTRAIVSADLLFKGVDFAFEGIKSAIEKSAEKYYQEYMVSLYNNTFYALNSDNGMLDPQNIMFNGFTLTRSVELNDGREVALYAEFTLDTTKLIDIYTQSKFYLKCDSLDIRLAKVKMNDKKWYTPWTYFMKQQDDINLDIEIDILANWIDNNGVIHKQVPFGKFYFPIRNHKVGTEDLSANHTELSGYSYLPPRSRTYCMSKRGKWYECYGQGDFDIVLKVTESSKNHKLNKVIYDNISILEGVDAQPIKDLIDK